MSIYVPLIFVSIFICVSLIFVFVHFNHYLCCSVLYLCPSLSFICASLLFFYICLFTLLSVCISGFVTISLYLSLSLLGPIFDFVTVSLALPIFLTYTVPLFLSILPTPLCVLISLHFPLSF